MKKTPCRNRLRGTRQAEMNLCLLLGPTNVTLRTEMEPRLHGGSQKSGNKHLRLQPNLGSDRTGSGTHGSGAKGPKGQGRNTGNPRGLLYRKGRLWVPEGLVDQVLRSGHDTKVAGHMGQDKIIELVQRNFW